MSEEFVSRIISLRADIDNESAGDVIDKILFINELDSEIPVDERLPIHLHIQSGGGCCADGYALVDIIETSETPIYTYCDGYVDSTATDIYLAGDKRYVYPHSTFLFHATKMAITESQHLSKLMSSVDYAKHINEFGKQMLRDKTKFDEDIIELIYGGAEDFTFYAEEALNCGIATDMICK